MINENSKVKSKKEYSELAMRSTTDSPACLCSEDLNVLIKGQISEAAGAPKVISEHLNNFNF